MKRLVQVLSALMLAGAVPVFGQQTPEAKPEVKAVVKPQDAQVLLDAALKKAKDQKKAVFVLFDASW